MVERVELLTTAEVAGVLGVSRKRVLEIAAANPAFPPSKPAALGGHAWSRETILTWAAAHPDLGPMHHGPSLPAVGSLAPKVRKVLNLATDEARALNHDWVGDEHLLLALADPTCPGAAQPVLASLGITAEWLREVITTGQGDPFEPRTGWITPSPAARSVLERAHLEAVLLADPEVTGEHVLLALASYWVNDTSTLVGPQHGGIDPAIVRRRVRDHTEGRSLPSHPAGDQSWLERDREAADQWPQNLELASNPDGKDPRQRRPWGSRMFVDSDGKPVLWPDKEPRQYFVDRDGYPVLTSDGWPVHVARGEHGQDVLDEVGRPVVTAVEIPEGSTVRSGV